MTFPFEDVKGPGLLPRTTYIMWGQRKENKMITERTLKKWRKEALEDVGIIKIRALTGLVTKYRSERILRLTQELLDQHLLRK